MAILSSTNTFTNTTPIASKTLDRASAVRPLQNHEQFLRCNPQFVGYEEMTPAPTLDAVRPPKTVVQPRAPRTYDVKHHVPNPVCSSDITSRETYVDCEDGVWVRTQSPMGIVMETRWFVQPAADGDGLEFVQSCEYTCSKVLTGIVRRQADAAWPEIHKNLIQAMVDTATAA